MATLVLRTVKGSPLTNLEVDGNFSNILTDVGLISNTANTINSNVGVLSNLTTTNTSNIVFAVNELKSNIGILSNLTTTATSNLVAAINEIASESTTNVTITGGNISGVTLSFLTSDDTSTNSTFFPTFQTASTGNAAIKISSSKLTFNPSSGLLSSTDYNSSSDISLKQDFVPINNSLDIISKLNGFGFTWRDSKEKSYGLSAQEVEQVIPEIVRTRSDGFKGINYMNLTAFLIEAIKDLKQEIQELKKHK
jgi:hypothetical protein